MTAEKLAIRNRLTNDSTYLTLLGDPSDEPYKTYYLYPPVTPDLPYVTFMLRPSAVDTEKDKTVVVKDTDLTFFIFATDYIYETIAGRIVYLLHQYGNSEGFRIIFQSEEDEEYKPELNVYAIKLTFKLHYRKEII